jgi:hypothetical protein
MKTEAQEISINNFKKWWHNANNRKYKNLNGAFWDVQIVYEPIKQGDIILLARVGKDNDSEVDNSWCEPSIYWLTQDGKIFESTDDDVLDLGIPQ